MRVVVTGGNGFVGFHTIRELLKQAFEVVAVDVDTSRLEESEMWLDTRLDAHKINILKPEFANLLKEGDIVLHLAAIAHRKDVDENPMLGFSVNVLGTLNIIQSCIKKKVNRIIYSSTGSVYSKAVQIPIREDAARHPHNLYGLSKKMAEDLILLFGSQLNYIILRYGYIFGPKKGRGAIYNFLTRIKDNKSPMVFGGIQTDDFIYVKDIVQANILAIQSPYNNMIYNIGTGKAINILEVAQQCLRITESNLAVEKKPYRWIDYPAFVYDIAKARSMLGYEPEYSLYKGLKEMIEEMSFTKSNTQAEAEADQ